MEVGYSTICRNLHEWGYNRIRPRPRAVRGDPVAREAFVKHVHVLVKYQQPDLWFQDETAFWADPAPYLTWARRGTRPVLPRLVTHDHVNVFGAVRPADGKFYAMIASHGNQRLFQISASSLRGRSERGCFATLPDHHRSRCGVKGATYSRKCPATYTFHLPFVQASGSERLKGDAHKRRHELGESTPARAPNQQTDL